MIDTRVGLCAGLASLAVLHYWNTIRCSKIRNPPSPPSLPLIGNLFSIPSDPEYIAFTKLGEQLGSDIVFLEMLGQKMIVLNNAEDASALFEKRSASYSDRPPIPMLKDPSLMNWATLPSLIEYNDIWRQYRRIMNNWLNMRAVTQFDDMQERMARSLLRQLLGAMKQPQPFEQVRHEFFYATSSLMFELAYGYKLQGPKDPFFKDAKSATHNVEVAAMPTNFFVNIFPTLSYIPDWFPGTGWKRTAREWAAQQCRAKTKPYEWLKTHIANGTQQHSLLGSLLQDHKFVSEMSPTERDERLKEVGIILYAGGTDTTSNFLVNLVAALVSNPDVQARAQKELDAVLGHAVLPTISDRERLPYIRNLIDEVLRFYPILPLAAPHTCYHDDIYKGYNIQKGTTVIGNVWAISRDPRRYQDPEVFNPDRFLDPDVPRSPVFGWGRRKCPGVYFAEASAFIVTASLLATFTFSKKRDTNGREITPQFEIERNSIVVQLKPFDFELKPRSDVHHQLILGAVDA